MIADKYDVIGLKKLCRKHFAHLITDDSVIMLLQQVFHIF